MNNEYMSDLGGSLELPTYSSSTYVSDEEVSKSQRLEAAKADKLSRLSKQNDFGNLEDSYTLLEDGRVEGNKNKIWNELSQTDLSSVFGYGVGNYSLQKDEEGNSYYTKDGEKVVYDGPTRRLYLYGTKEDPDNIKLGLSTGTSPTSDVRYDREVAESYGLNAYGWESGPEGVDIGKKHLDVLLPYNVATMLEGMSHGNLGALSNRVLKDRYGDVDAAEALGSGASEYYTSPEGLFGTSNENTVVPDYKSILGQYLSEQQIRSPGKGIVDSEAFNQYVAQDIRQQEADNIGYGGKLLNAGQGFLSAFAEAAFVDPADALGEITGLWDLGTDEEKNRFTNDFFGYNELTSAKGMQEAQELGRKITDGIFDKDKELDLTDFLKIGWIAVQNPEILGESLGTTFAMLLPVAGQAGKGIKVANAVTNAQKALKAGEISRKAADRIIGTAKIVEGASNLAKRAAPIGLVTAGQVNDQIDDYKELYGTDPSIGKVASMFVTQGVMNAIDLVVDIGILKNTKGAIESLAAGVKLLPEQGKAALVGKALGVMGSLSASGTKEGLQEYAQTMGEILNVQLNIDEEGTPTVGEILSDRENVAEGITAAGLGAGMGAEMRAIGMVADNVGPGFNKIKETTLNTTNKNNAPVNKNTTATSEDSYTPSSEQVDAANSVISSIASLYGKEDGSIDYNSFVVKSLEEISSNKESPNTEKDAVNKIKDAYDSLIEGGMTAGAVKISSTLKEKNPELYKKVFTDSAVGERESYQKALITVMGSLANKDTADFSQIGNILDSAELLIEEPSDYALKSPMRGQAVSAAKAAISTYNDLIKANPQVLVGNKDIKPEARSATAERVLVTSLEFSKGKDTELNGKLASFARFNGVKEEKISNLIKSFEAVDEEAFEWARGVYPRESRMKAMIAADRPNKKLLKREYEGTLSFYHSTDSSVKALEKGVKEAQVKANGLNRAASTKAGSLASKKTQMFKTSYKKSDGSLFEIAIKYDGVKWEADLTQAQEVLDRKTKTRDELKRVINEVSALGKSLIDAVATDTIIVPEASEKSTPGVKAARTKTKNYHSAVNSIVSKITNKDVSINKVIIDQSAQNTPSQWKAPSGKDSGGAYYKTNAHRVNTGEYVADDVVLLVAHGFFKNKEGKVVSNLNTTKEGAPEVLNEVAKAIKAGSTIVLDESMFFTMKSDNATSSKDSSSTNDIAVTVKSFLDRAGYLAVDPSKFIVGKSTSAKKYVFMPKDLIQSDEAKAAIEAIDVEEAAAKEKEKELKNTKNKTLKLKTGLETGLAEDGKELDDDRRKTLTDRYNDYIEEIAKSYKNENIDKAIEAANKNIEKLYTEELNKQIIAIRNATGDGEGAIEGIDPRMYTKALEIVEKETESEAEVASVIEAWKKVSEVERVGKKGLNSRLKEVFEGTVLEGIIPGDIVKTYLKDKASGTGKGYAWETVVYNKKDGRYSFRHSSKEDKELSAKIAEEFAKEVPGRIPVKGNSSEDLMVVAYRKIAVDPTLYTTVTTATLINTIPFDMLPSSLKELGEQTASTIKSYILPLTESEKREGEGYKDVSEDTGKFEKNNLATADSPSRGIIFDRNGNINKETALAIGLAIHEVIKTDKSSLIVGYKSDFDIAKMFNVNTFEITPAMRKFARENGVLGKTIQTALGKAVLKNLGIGRTINEEVAVGTFETLVADIGNVALQVGLKDGKSGIFQKTEVSSNSIEQLFKKDSDSESRVTYPDETTTSFIKIKGRDDKLVQSYDKFIAANEKYLPDLKSSTRLPNFESPTDLEVEEMVSNIHNDIADAAVPAEAQEALRTMIKTEYSVDVNRINAFLELIDTHGDSIKAQLGYIEIDDSNPKYQKLLGVDKTIQESINQDIESSIQKLRDFVELADRNGKIDNGTAKVFFDYMYIGNGRYQMNSTGINPQTDKIHRFLVQPTSHTVKLNFDSNSGLFKEEGANEDNTLNVSLDVRIALAQAMGRPVDKESDVHAIKFANGLLSLTKEQLGSLKEDILTSGKSELNVTENGNTVIYEIEAEHLSHTLQAIEFLNQLKDGSGTVTTSLTAEFDSLTSGFFNKMQQFILLGGVGSADNIAANAELHAHFARVGIVTEIGRSLLKNSEELFNPDKGGATNKVLESGHIKDSYKNLAFKVLDSGAKGLLNEVTSSKSISNPVGIKTAFKQIIEALPGNLSMEDDNASTEGNKKEVPITSAIRKMFKNPFMIFNYAASIKTIVKNMGYDMSMGLLRDIAAMDLKAEDIKDTPTYKAAEFLSNKLDTNVKTSKVAELQKMLRDPSKSTIKIVPTVLYQIDGKNIIVKTLEDLLVETVSMTYGSKVRSVFENEFRPFIELQDVINDSFRVMYDVFNYKLTKSLQEKMHNGVVITEKVIKESLNEFYDDFPYIVGPMTADSNKAIIPITDKGVVTNSPTAVGRRPGQVYLNNKEGENATVKANPIVMRFEAAVNSGSVLPFHYIDGALLGRMLNSLTKEFGESAGITPIHDAEMIKVGLFDKSGWAYNKAAYETNRDYSILDSLKDKMDSLNTDGVPLEEFSTRSLKSAKTSNKEQLSYSDALLVIKDKLDSIHLLNEQVRKLAYNEAGTGFLDTAIIGNLVGSPGFSYIPNTDGPNTSYLQTYKKEFVINKDLTAELVNPEEPRVSNPNESINDGENRIGESNGVPVELQRVSRFASIRGNEKAFELIKMSLANTYPDIDVSIVDTLKDQFEEDVLGMAVGNMVTVANNASLDTLPHEYAHVYINMLESTIPMSNALNSIQRAKKVDRPEAKEILAQFMGEYYAEDKLISMHGKPFVGAVMKLAKALWIRVKNVFRDESMIKAAKLFASGDVKEAIKFKPNEHYRRVDTEKTLEENKLAAEVFTLIDNMGNISKPVLTGSVALAANGSVYRKSTNGAVDLHDLDVIVEEKDISSIVKKLQTTFEVTPAYEYRLKDLNMLQGALFGLYANTPVGNLVPESISKKGSLKGDGALVNTTIITKKGFKAVNIKRYNNRSGLRITDYDIVDNNGKVVGTYKAILEKPKTIFGIPGKIKEEIFTGERAVVLDLFGNKEEAGPIPYYSEALKKDVLINSPSAIFRAKNLLGSEKPREKDVLDINFYSDGSIKSGIIKELNYINRKCK